MAFGHVGALDHDAVEIRHAARVHRRRAPPEPCPQPGDAGALTVGQASTPIYGISVGTLLTQYSATPGAHIFATDRKH